MRKDFFREIQIPENVRIEIKDGFLLVKGPEGENSRNFKLGKIQMTSEAGKIIIGAVGATKREKRLINTFFAHIMNMINGVQEKFEYLLKICHSHFPMTVKFENKNFIVKNFLGEKKERTAFIPNDVDIEIKGQIITVKSINKEIAGDTVSRIEGITKRIGRRDKRNFQDGIYLIKNCGKEI